MGSHPLVSPPPPSVCAGLSTGRKMEESFFSGSLSLSADDEGTFRFSLKKSLLTLGCNEQRSTDRLVINIRIYKRLYFLDLKEYYEIVDEARPLSGFFPTHADFNAFLIMKLSKLPKFQSDPSSP